MHVDTLAPRIYRHPIVNTYTGLQRSERLRRLFNIHKVFFNLTIQYVCTIPKILKQRNSKH